MTEQLLLIETDVVVLRPVEMEGSHRRHGTWAPRYWVCTCGTTLHHNQVIKHLCSYHFYSERDARAVFRQAKLGQPQHLPRLIHLLGGGDSNGNVQAVSIRDTFHPDGEGTPDAG